MDFEIDLATIRRGWEAIKGVPSGPKEPLRYSLDPKPNAPPSSYQTALSPAGCLEVIMPRPGVGKIVGGLFGCAFMAVWLWTALANGGGLFVVFGVVGAGFAVYNIGQIAFHRIFETRWSATNGRLTRRVVSGDGSCVQEKAFEHINAVQIDNRVWKTGGGSSDKLQAQCGEIYFPKTVTLRKVDAKRTKRQSTGPHRPAIATEILELGEYLAGQAHVPLDVAVSHVADPTAE